jgi:hypothetical protein
MSNPVRVNLAFIEAMFKNIDGLAATDDRVDGNLKGWTFHDEGRYEATLARFRRYVTPYVFAMEPYWLERTKLAMQFVLTFAPEEFEPRYRRLVTVFPLPTPTNLVLEALFNDLYPNESWALPGDRSDYFCVDDIDEANSVELRWSAWVPSPYSDEDVRPVITRRNKPFHKFDDPKLNAAVLDHWAKRPGRWTKPHKINLKWSEALFDNISTLAELDPCVKPELEFGDEVSDLNERCRRMIEKYVFPYVRTWDNASLALAKEALQYILIIVPFRAGELFSSIHTSFADPKPSLLLYRWMWDEFFLGESPEIDRDRTYEISNDWKSSRPTRDTSLPVPSPFIGESFRDEQRPHGPFMRVNLLMANIPFDNVYYRDIIAEQFFEIRIELRIVTTAPNHEHIRHIIWKYAVPYALAMGDATLQRIRIALQYVLTFQRDMGPYPRIKTGWNPNPEPTILLYQWLWEGLFPGENYELDQSEFYDIVWDDEEIKNIAINPAALIPSPFIHETYRTYPLFPYDR